MASVLLVPGFACLCNGPLHLGEGSGGDMGQRARPLPGPTRAGTRGRSAPAGRTEAKAVAWGLVREQLWGSPGLWDGGSGWEWRRKGQDSQGHRDTPQGEGQQQR